MLNKLKNALLMMLLAISFLSTVAVLAGLAWILRDASSITEMIVATAPILGGILFVRWLLKKADEGNQLGS
jgi:hypothetical protein